MSSVPSISPSAQKLDWKGSLEAVADDIHKTAVEHGWWDDLARMQQQIGNAVAPLDEIAKSRHQAELAYQLSKMMLICSEVSEAVEGLRDHNKADDKLPQYKMVEVEMADVLIRVFDLCKKFDWNVIDAMLDKMEYNKSRPYKHGKSI